MGGGPRGAPALPGAGASGAGAETATPAGGHWKKRAEAASHCQPHPAPLTPEEPVLERASQAAAG